MLFLNIPRVYQKETRAQLRLLVPFLIGQLSACAMGTVDTLMAGWAGTVDLSGVALGCAFYWPAYLFLAGVAYGITPTTSHLIATRNFKLMQQSFFNAIVITAIAGFITAVILSQTTLIFNFIPSDQNMIEVATNYIYFVSLSLPATAIYNGYKAYAEGLGITKPTLYFGLLQIILDIPLNYIFIFGKFGMPALGGVGCGATSCFINIICCFALMYYVKKAKVFNEYKVEEKTNIFNREIIHQYLKLSLPLGLARTIEVACFSFAAIVLSPFGPTIVAAHSITLNVSGMIFMIPLCIGMTVTIRTSMAMGKQNWVKLYVAIRTALAINLISFTTYFLCLFFLREDVASLYTSDKEVLAITTSLMVLNCIYMFPDSMQALFGGVLQGLKDSKTILFNTILSYWIVGLPLGSCLAWGIFTQKLEASGIWIGSIFSLTVAASVYIGRVIYILRTRKVPKLLAQSYQIDNKY